MPMTVSNSSTASSPEGLAFVCTVAGDVRRVVRASLAEAAIASSLGDSVSESSRDAAAVFLRAVSRAGFARSVPLRIGMRDVHCFGILQPGKEGDIRVVGTIDPLEAAPFAHDVAATQFEPGFETLAQEIRRTHSTYELYEELARTNNELVTAQRELARTNAELERLNAWKTEILGMAAHDLRNPLAANKGFITFLQQDQDAFPEDSRMLLRRLQSNSDYMLRLVESVLDFSAIESGTVRLNRELTSLADAVEEVVITLRVVAEAKRVAIELTMAELPPINIDRIKIMEALHNLIGNAVQYSPSGSAVAVRVRREDEFALIDIEDRGPGIPEDEIPDLFQPFKRLSTAKLGRRRSVGLGLAITRRLVEAHAGTITIDSTVGKGTTFTVHLPLA